MMLTLADLGHKVVGIEWSKIAVEAFFEENKLTFDLLVYKFDWKSIPLYQAKEKAISIYCADFFLKITEALDHSTV